MSDLSQLLLSWCNSFKKANDFDAWGQIVEASEEYNRLFKRVKRKLAPDNDLFTDEQKKFLSKVAVCLEMRYRSLQNSEVEQISLNGLKQVYPVLENILSGSKKPFPVKVELQKCNIEIEENFTVDDDFPGDQDEKKGGTLLPQIPYEANYHRLTIRIIKIGLKDPSDYINPFITVSVKDSNGVNIDVSQDTSVSKIREDKYIVFSNDVEIQQVMEKLPKGSAVFFEFKHFKPKKKTVSTKCWAFMELDELKAGPACIELYKKPTDCLRKKLSLLTIKPLYLHLHLTVHDDDDDDGDGDDDDDAADDDDEKDEKDNDDQ